MRWSTLSAKDRRSAIGRSTVALLCILSAVDPLGWWYRGPVTNIFANCGIAAGQTITAESISVACGITTEKIRNVIGRLLSNRDIMQAVDDGRHGRQIDPRVVSALSNALSLRSGEVTTIVVMLSAQNFAPDDAIHQLSLAAKRYLDLTAASGVMSAGRGSQGQSEGRLSSSSQVHPSDATFPGVDAKDLMDYKGECSFNSPCKIVLNRTYAVAGPISFDYRGPFAHITSIFLLSIPQGNGSFHFSYQIQAPSNLDQAPGFHTQSHYHINMSISTSGTSTVGEQRVTLAGQSEKYDFSVGLDESKDHLVVLSAVITQPDDTSAGFSPALHYTFSFSSG
jgi:hypothetical protein